MTGPTLRWVLLCLAFVLCTANAGAARADAFPPGSTCHIFGADGVGYDRLAGTPARWTCQSHQWGSRLPRGWVRFDLAGRERPVSLITRISYFSGLAVGIVRSDGIVNWAEYRMSEIRPLGSGLDFAIALPKLPEEASAIVLRVDRPGNRTILSEAHLAGPGEIAGWSQENLLLIAGICGIMIAPLAFNVAFYRVLRERFVIWHSIMMAGMFGYTLVSSGLINRIYLFDIATLGVLNPLLFCVPVAMAGFFSADFIEPGQLSPAMRRGLRVAGVWALVLPGVLSFVQVSLYPYANDAYFLTFGLTLVVYIAAMAQAALRKSRAVCFQIVGWTPVILAGVERILRGMGLYGAPSEMDQAIYAAIAIEIMATALGVADRFMVIKRQRDRARIQAQMLLGRAERDPLTGLLNRRAIEPRFAQLEAEGYRAFAVIDLDNFKQVNDTYGHAVGDKVLVAASAALAPDRDTLAMRLGGEEFMLLLRGPDVALRAERRRQAIASRVAADVPGLGRPVTASMGLVEYPVGEVQDNSFLQLYAHCDRLLYAAKHGGRNRTMSEALPAFRHDPDFAGRAV